MVIVYILSILSMELSTKMQILDLSNKYILFYILLS